MRRIGRLLVLLAVLLPVGVVAAGTAQGASGGVGPAVLKCMHFKDAIVISPGVTNTPAAQKVDAHGRLYGCNKAGGSAQFSASMHMDAATCSELTMAGTGEFAWANGHTSTADLTFTPQVAEPNKVFVSGSITSGPFSGLIVQAWVRFTKVFTGTGAPCSATNPLKHIDFTNSQSYQLLTPPTTTTTVPVQPSTTTEPRSTTTSTTVPRTTTSSSSTSSSSTSSSTTPSSTSTSSSTSTTTSTVPVTIAGSTTSTAAATPSTTAPPSGGTSAVVVRGTGTGGLAFTGNNSTGALIGLESLLIGGALACFGQDRKNRRTVRRSSGAVKDWLVVALPPKD